MDDSINWDRAAPNPVALVFLPWELGVTIVKRDISGGLHGCRDVARGEHFADCIRAWVSSEHERGLRIEDRAGVLREIGSKAA